MTGLLDRVLNYIADHAWKGYGAMSASIGNRTSSNPYTIPSDGLLRVVCTYRAGSYIIAYVDGEIVAEPSTPGNAGLQGNSIVCVPVFKGQKVYFDRSSTYSYANFIPYKNMGGGGYWLTSSPDWRWLHDWVKRQDSEFLGGFRCKHRRRSSTSSRYSKLWSVQRYNRDFSQKLQICACCSSGVSLRFNSRNIRPMYSRCSFDNCDWLQDTSLQWRHGSKISGHSLDSYGTVTPERGCAA